MNFKKEILQGVSLQSRYKYLEQMDILFAISRNLSRSPYKKVVLISFDMHWRFAH